MRILHVTTTDISLELLLGDQLSELVSRGHQVHATAAPGEYVDRLVARGVKFHPLEGSTRSMDLVADLRAARNLRKLLQDIRPDILHTHNPKPGVYGRIVGRSVRGIRVVNTVHGLFAQPSDHILARLVWNGMERLAASFSHEELFQNGEDMEVYRRLRVNPQKLTLLGNGINLDRFRTPTALERSRARSSLGIPDSQIVIGSVSRLVNEKGVNEILAAHRQLKETLGQSIGLVIVGERDDSRRDALSPATISGAANEGCQFLGHRSDVEKLYWAMDIFVSASYREGYPRTVMEASATGLPIVATDIRGTRDAITADCGVLVPARNAELLFQALLALVNDTERRRSLALAAIDRATGTFDFRRQVAISESVYRR